MCTEKHIHQTKQIVVLFVEWQVQKHSAPSSGKYPAACRALPSSTCRSSPCYKYRTDRTLLGAEGRLFLGPNSCHREVDFLLAGLEMAII